MYEFVGIAASVIVLISFVIKGELKIRTINIFGATLFVVYGLLIGSLSVWLLNGILIGVHAYYLAKGIKEK